jgi:hypothetical protein
VSRLIVLETADLRGKAGALFRVELLQPFLSRSEDKSGLEVKIIIPR